MDYFLWIFNIFFTSVFTGFSIVIPVLLLLPFKNGQAKEFRGFFIDTAIKLLRLSGIAYLFFFMLDTYILYTQQGVNFLNHITGAYWLYYWFSPLMYLFLSQLLWIKKLWSKKGGLIIFSLLLLLLPSQKFLVFMAAFNRDYLLSSWSMYTSDIVIEFVLNIIVFIFTILTITLLTNKLRTNIKA
ncbi:hypothetical protein [Flavobacterium alkalisoli]|uniref:hypothetical protein n=1 Tax=Flavobacterium alkalisoli TaxID=2602769 RepID=UPI003A911A64